jgi:hypothetical protein
MTDPLDLKAIERKAYTSKYRDGLWEISCGFMVLYWQGFSTLMNSGGGHDWRKWMPLAFVLVFVPVIIVARIRARVTAPRLGIVKPGPVRRKKLRTMGWVLGGLIAVQVLVVFLTSRGEFGLTGMLAPVVGGFIVFLPIAAIAFWNDFTRGFIYAALLGATVSIYMIVNSWIPFVAVGGVILLTGIVVFVRFLRDYPVPIDLT